MDGFLGAPAKHMRFSKLKNAGADRKQKRKEENGEGEREQERERERERESENRPLGNANGLVHCGGVRALRLAATLLTS